MLVLVLVLVIGAIVFGVGSFIVGAGRGFDDVERFHRARGITTEWARRGVTSPLMAEELLREGEPRREEERVSADA